MRLILHIGLHRAASTSIQQLLEDRAGKLRKEGIVTVTQGMTNAPEYKVFKDLRGHVVARKDLPRTVEAFQRWIDREAGDCRCMIYSNENLPGLMPGKRQKALGHSQDLARLISALRQDHDVDVLVVLREHLGYLRSVYNARRMRTHVGSFSDFAGSIDLQSMSFSGMLDAVAGAAGREHTHVFDFEDIRQGRDRGVVDGIADLAGSHCIRGARLPARNMSAPGRQMAIFDALNSAGIFIPLGRARNRLMHAAAAIDDLSEPEAVAGVYQAVRADGLRVPFSICSERRLRIATWLHQSGYLNRFAPVRECDLARILATAQAALADPSCASGKERALWQRFADDRNRIAREWLPAWAGLPPPA